MGKNEVGTKEQSQEKIDNTVAELGHAAEVIGKLTAKVAKYGVIIAGIATLDPAAIILGIPALDLTVSKDIATVAAPDNEKVKEMPTGVGEALGYMVDKTIEAKTGEKSNSLFTQIGGAMETLFNASTLFKKPVISKRLPENID